MQEIDSYVLFVYDSNGQQVVSAVHALDIRKFVTEHPDAKVHKPAEKK
jgi:hypothetical protein